MVAVISSVYTGRDEFHRDYKFTGPCREKTKRTEKVFYKHFCLASTLPLTPKSLYSMKIKPPFCEFFSLPVNSYTVLCGFKEPIFIIKYKFKKKIRSSGRVFWCYYPSVNVTPSTNLFFLFVILTSQMLYSCNYVTYHFDIFMQHNFLEIHLHF